MFHRSRCGPGHMSWADWILMWVNRMSWVRSWMGRWRCRWPCHRWSGSRGDRWWLWRPRWRCSRRLWWSRPWRQRRSPREHSSNRVRVGQIKSNYHGQDSVPKPRSRALSHSRHVVRSCPNWHKTAFKFQRIRCTTCFTSPETKETTPAGKGHACCLLSHMSCWSSRARAAVVRNEVSECSERHHTVEELAQRISKDSRNSGTS